VALVLQKVLRLNCPKYKNYDMQTTKAAVPAQLLRKKKKKRCPCLAAGHLNQ